MTSKIEFFKIYLDSKQIEIASNNTSKFFNELEQLLNYFRNNGRSNVDNKCREEAKIVSKELSKDFLRYASSRLFRIR
jgi:hypothetical protein